MNIQLGNWKIETLDSLNVGLFQKRTNNNKKSDKCGEEYWDCVGYYGNLEHALNGYVKKACVIAEGTTLEEILKEVQAIHETINAICSLKAL